VAGDPYVYPGTDVLRNKLGIRNAAQLTVVETDLHDLRAAQLAERPIPGRYDLGHLQRFHRHLFGDVYEWAGQIRTVAIAKSDMFALPQFIESYANESLRPLADEQHLQGLDRDEFASKVAGYFADVNAAHPFREGNGRSQRAFFGQLARDAGYEIAWEHVDPERNIEASIAAIRGDERPLRKLLAEATTKLTRVLERDSASRDEFDDDLRIDL